MQKIFFFFFILLNFSILHAQNEEKQENSPPQFEIFEIQEGDTTYVMKKYYLCLLKTGPNRTHSKEEAAKIQEAHLGNINKLAADKKLCVAGPTGDDSSLRGIFILSTYTQEEAEALVAQDPAIKAGRLIAEIHPWWGAVGTKLF